MSAARNGNGYDISSQNYFRELSQLLGEPIDPVRHQSVSEARAKIRWQAFEFLLGQANLESSRLSSEFKFKGHITRAIDGTSFFTQRTDDLLEHFSLRNTSSEEGETHYPYALCLTAINVFTAQPTHAVVDNYRKSERSLLRAMISQFGPGDISLLDRGLGGAQVYLEFQERGQFFIHRTKTTGDRVAGYIEMFLSSGEKERKIQIPVKDEETGEEVSVVLRLVLGPVDSEGKPIVFVTNLICKTRYRRKEIMAMYEKRWSVETLYDRVKNLLCLEKFHARTYNGVMQEIFACLLVLSLTALAVTAVVKEDGTHVERELPSFKNATESIRRNLFSIIDGGITEITPKQLMRILLKEVRSVMYPVRPGRSYPRVSMQPIQSWNLKKSAKTKAFRKRMAD